MLDRACLQTIEQIIPHWFLEGHFIDANIPLLLSSLQISQVDMNNSHHSLGNKQTQDPQMLIQLWISLVKANGNR